MYDNEAGRRKALAIMVAVAGLVAAMVAFFTFGPWLSLDAGLHLPLDAKLPIENVDYLYTIAQNSMERGNTAYAAEVARRILIVNPREIRAMKMLISIALKRSDYVEVIARSNQVLKADPHDETARLSLATAYNAVHDKVRAKEALLSLAGDTSCTADARGAAVSALIGMGETPPDIDISPAASPSPGVPPDLLPAATSGVSEPPLLQPSTPLPAAPEPVPSSPPAVVR